MGIQGLLPLLKDIQKRVSVSKFNGKAVGIDGYCWLHKGVYGCAKDVVEGKKTNVYINYVLRRINMLLNYNIKPVMVFDGGYLPAKASKEKERRGQRQENLKKAKALLRAGNNSQAYEHFQRCVEITPAMATEVIQACREKNILCVVAPYEADAQLAYLEMQGITDFTITEDSDLLIYGCKKVLFKMNSDGDGIFINLDELNRVKTVALESFTMQKFRHMCILSGCDYLPSIKGLGLYKAHKYLRKSTNVYKAIQLIRQEKKLKVPDGYEDSFRKTDAVFKYQSVFDPRSKKIVRLNEVAQDDNVTDEELTFAGPDIDEAKAVRIALGNLDPISGETLADFSEFLNQKKPRQQTVSSHTFVEKLSKPRDPKLHYSLGDESSECGSSDQLLEENYLEKDDRQNNSDDENDTKKTLLPHFFGKQNDDLSPPERSLRNIHLYEMENPSPFSSIGALYEEKGYKAPASHHSVFVKRKRHKLRNPFRVFEDDNEEMSSSLKSRYFSSQDNTSETENDLKSRSEAAMISDRSDSDDLLFDANDDTNACCSESMESPPDSKRVKLSFVEYLDSHSKISLKQEASKMLGDEVAFSMHTGEKCNPGMKNCDQKIDRFKSSINSVKPKSDESDPKIDLDNLKTDNCKLGTGKCSTDVNNDIQLIESEKSKDVMPRLPAMPSSFLDKENQREASSLKLGPLNGRISLFKFTKSRHVGEMSKEIKSQENNLSSKDGEAKTDEEKAASLHLQTRSYSEPTLQSQSSKKSTLGKCKKIGLSRGSKSSMERVRDKDPTLTQLKIGFERFSYTKKRIKPTDDVNDEVICIS